MRTTDRWRFADLGRGFLISGLLVISIGIPPVARAFPIASTGAGKRVYVTSSTPVVATYRGNSANYSNDLYLVSHGGERRKLFNNHENKVGDQVELGVFPIGTELVFSILVNDTGHNFSTGPGDRNPDGRPHARVQDDWKPGEVLVSFEDLYEGPFNFNDLSFSFTNVRSSPVIEAIAATRAAPPCEPLERDETASPDDLIRLRVHVAGLERDEASPPGELIRIRVQVATPKSVGAVDVSIRSERTGDQLSLIADRSAIVPAQLQDYSPEQCDDGPYLYTQPFRPTATELAPSAK